jgi:putative transposase
LSIVVDGANRHDVKLLEQTLESVVVERPTASTEAPQHLCADAGYLGEPARRAMESYGYTPHVRSRNEEIQAKVQNPKHRARRWVVEVSHSWLNRFRKLLVRFEKTHRSYFALFMLGCAIIAVRKAGIPGKANIIYGSAMKV